MTELRPDDLRSDFYNRTGEQALIAFSIECSDSSFFKTQNIEVPAIEYMKHLEYMVLELKAQLTWRPVSEKPKKAGVYFVEARPYEGCDSTTITTAYFDGESFLWHDVVRWLPIPPQGDKL